MSKAILTQFGERLRLLRKERNLSQEKLGMKSELHRTYIGMIERGEKNITLVNLQKLAIALDIPLKDLLDF